MTDWQWYYSHPKRKERAGPVSTELLRTMLAKNELPPKTLVWREGLAGWVPARSILTWDDLLVPVSVMPEGRAPVPFALRGWMIFLGVALLIVGGLLSVVLVGIPLFLAGLGLLRAAIALDDPRGVEAGMLPFLERLRFTFASLGCLWVAFLLLLIPLGLLFMWLGAYFMQGFQEGITLGISGTLP